MVEVTYFYNHVVLFGVSHNECKVLTIGDYYYYYSINTRRNHIDLK